MELLKKKKTHNVVLVCDYFPPYFFSKLNGPRKIYNKNCYPPMAFVHHSQLRIRPSPRFAGLRRGSGIGLGPLAFSILTMHACLKKEYLSGGFSILKTRPLVKP